MSTDFSSLYCATPGLKAGCESTSKPLLSSGPCDCAGGGPEKPASAAEPEEMLCFTMFKALIVCTSDRTIRVLTFTLPPGGRYGTFLTDSPPLKGNNAHFIRERESGVGKKNVSFVLLEAVNVTAHCKEMFPVPGLRNQSEGLQGKAFHPLSWQFRC